MISPLQKKFSRAAVFASSALLMSISCSSFAATAPGPAPARVGVDLPETAARYEALHKALVAAAFPEDIKEKCLDETEFTKPGSWARSNACTASKGSRSWDTECTPECVEYFEKAGVDCELAEDAAKLQVAKALEDALEGTPMSGPNKQALYAWYRFYYSLYGFKDEEGVKVDTLVKHIQEEIASGESDSTVSFLNAELSEDAVAGYDSDNKANYIAKCVKTAGEAAIDSTPGSSALSHGSFVSGVIGSVAYAFLL
jgi:hypothetical protein